MSHFVGLDVSQKMTAICVVDKEGRRIWRGQRPSVPEQISAALRRYAGDNARIGIETVPTSRRLSGPCLSPGGNCAYRSRLSTSNPRNGANEWGVAPSDECAW